MGRRSRGANGIGSRPEMLAGCEQLLRPGGLPVLTARPWRRREQLVDFPGQLARTAEAAGLLPSSAMWRCWGLSGDGLVGRPSFFQLGRVRKARVRGLPLRIIAHEDVLVFRWVGPSPADRGRERR